jgi:hypothetical protein|tara:strand:+ start:1089 stop:1190 length:102 start_codon:yes stop_codon:yes gene_type:complete
MDSKVITRIPMDKDKKMIINELGDYLERVFSTK